MRRPAGEESQAEARPSDRRGLRPTGGKSGAVLVGFVALPKHGPLRILIAEDDPNDRKLVALAAANRGDVAELFWVGDGGEVLEYLQGEGPYEDRRQYPSPRCWCWI